MPRRHGRAQRCARRRSRPSAWCWPRARRWPADGDLLEPAERADRALVEPSSIARATDAHAIEAAVKALADGTEAFAAARMNQGIRQALAGKRLEEV
jgi:hypothetical protein